MKRTASETNLPDSKKPNVEAACKAIIFCGAPGSGKGTQCEKLVTEFGFHHLSTGDLLRDAVKANNDLGKQANAYMAKGELVPDALVIGLVQEQLQKPELKDKGWILDGYPRTKAQAEALTSAGVVPDKIIFLEVPDSVLTERVCGRRSDPTTGAIYHVKFNPPPAELAARVITREDDTEEKLKTRLANYHANNKTILDYYDGKVIVDKIDGIQLPNEVYTSVRNSVLVKASTGPTSALAAPTGPAGAPAGAPGVPAEPAKPEKKGPKTKPVYIEYDEEEDSSEEEEQNSGDDYRDEGDGGDDDDDVDDDAPEEDD